MNTEHVYILRLADDFWYVGMSRNISDRIQRHAGNRGATKWTRLHKVLDVVYVAPGSFKDEHTITRDMMHLYGRDNVRGGKYSQPDFPGKADWSWETGYVPRIITQPF